MTKRQIIILGVSVILILAASLGIAKFFINLKEESKPAPHAKLIRKVESEFVNYSEIETTISASGRVLSQQSVDIISEVQGKLMAGNISLKKGSNFKQGDLLVKVYSTDYLYSLQSKKSSFLNTLANILPDLKIDYPESYTKWLEFFEGVQIEKDLPPLPEFGSNQEKIFLSGRGILSTYYSIKSGEIQLKKYNIYAPFNGAIQTVTLEVGSVANPGSRIASIIKTGELEIEVPIEVSESEWVTKGQRVLIKDENGNAIGKGKVIREASFVDNNSQSINIYVSILSGTKKVFTGQYLQVEFGGMQVKDAMEIPRNAIFNQNEVFIVDSGYLAKKEINVLKINEKTLLFNGLDEGVEVVTQPLANANENIPVQTKNSNVHFVKADSSSINKSIKE